MFVFFGAGIDKGVEKNIQNETCAKMFFSDQHVYTAEGYE